MICAIVLAAGHSRRMGRQKLLLPFGGSTLIARVVDAFLGPPVERVFVVVSPSHQPLRDALGNRPVHFVENPDLEGDMLSSVRCGLRALPSRTEVIAVSPGDQPSLHPELVSEILAAYQAGSGTVLVPVHHGRRGHPLVFAAHYRQELLTSFDGIGLRGLLQAHAADVIEFPTQNSAVLQDLDTPADYDSAGR